MASGLPKDTPVLLCPCTKACISQTGSHIENFLLCGPAPFLVYILGSVRLVVYHTRKTDTKNCDRLACAECTRPAHAWANSILFKTLFVRNETSVLGTYTVRLECISVGGSIRKFGRLHCESSSSLLLRLRGTQVVLNLLMAFKQL